MGRFIVLLCFCFVPCFPGFWLVGCRTPPVGATAEFRGPAVPEVAAPSFAPVLSPTTNQPSVASPSSTAARTYPLQVVEHWLLNPPNGERFDASALLKLADGRFLTVNDKGPEIYRIDFRNAGVANLVREPAWFTPAQRREIGDGKYGHWDLEGLARDEAGRIYLSEELNRWVLRADPASGHMERLEIDWAPVQKWFSSERNSSWEGIAVGTDGRLYLANERDTGRIVVVDLATLKVVDSFQVLPVGKTARNIHYSDLSWFDGHLWVLCRQSQRVVKVDPRTHRVIADFDYSGIEFSSEYGYVTLLPYGQYEGLSVDATNIWLLIDNNGSRRYKDAKDIRPTLFRCVRPDRPL